MVERNPFTPTFGIVPAYLAGRDGVLREMARAFEAGLGDPNLATVVVGPRGSGKTALLSCIGDEARRAGWLVADTVAAPGMLEDVLQRAASAASGLVGAPGRARITGVSVGQLLGLEWALDEPAPANWRTRMGALLDGLAEQGAGLLVTVDEIDPGVDELVQLASVYQLFVREGRQVALVMAGLPAAATDLADDRRVTFLRRARKRHLAPIGDAEAARAFRKTFASSGREIGDRLVARLVEAAGGFPYMMQLVGYNVWAEGDPGRPVSDADVERGLAAAREEFEENSLRGTLRDLSEGDLAFARAMLADGRASTLADVAARMGKPTNYASTYRSRLMKQGVIADNGDKTFSFAIPLLREFLQGD